MSRRLPLAITWKYKILFHFVVTRHYTLHSTMWHLVTYYSVLHLDLSYVTILPIITNYSYFPVPIIHLLETKPYGSKLHTSPCNTVTVTFSSHWYHIYPQKSYFVTFSPSRRSQFFNFQTVYILPYFFRYPLLAGVDRG